MSFSKHSNGGEQDKHDYRVGPETWVEISWSARDAEGKPVIVAAPTLSFVFGRGKVWPRLEQRLEGLTVGQEATLRLTADEAFGPRDPKGIVEVDRADFPEHTSAGDRFEAESEQGHTVVITVLDVAPDSVTVDLNHPLAGQGLEISVRVQAVRPASSEELRAAERELELLTQAPKERLISVDDLLKGGGTSYDRPKKN